MPPIARAVPADIACRRVAPRPPSRSHLRFACALRLAVLGAALAVTPVFAGIAFETPETVFSDGLEPFVRLQGEAGFLDPLADAQVRVQTSRGRSAEGIAGADGSFALRLSGLESDELVWATARGVGPQSSLEFASTFGDFDFLLQTAGSARDLGVADVPALRLNPHQTALHVGMRDLPDSGLSPQGRSFALLSGGFNSVDVFFNRGPLLALMAAGDLPLPTGATTTLEAVSDLAMATEAFEAANALPYEPVPGNPWFDALERIARDPAQVAVLAQPPLGLTVHSYYPISRGSGGGAGRVALAGDGTGVYGDESTPLVPIDWAPGAFANTVRIVRQDGQPFSLQESFNFHPSCNCQVRTLFEVAAYHLLFATGPGNGLMLASSSESRRLYPDNPEIPTEDLPVAAPGFYYPALVDDAPRAAFPDPAGQTFLLPRCAVPDCSPYELLGSFSTFGLVDEPHRFDAGGQGSTLRVGEDFTWTLETDGSLTVDYAGGGSTRFRLASHDLAYGTVVALHTMQGGGVLPFHSQYLPMAGDRAFVESDIVDRTYETGFACDHPFAAIDGFCSSLTEIQGQAGGAGIFGGRNSTWAIDADGRMVWRRLNGDGSTFQLRTWEKLSEDATYLYALETWCGAITNPPPETPPCFGPTSRILALRKL